MDEEKKPALKQRLQIKKRSKKLKKQARRVEGATVRHAHRFLVGRWDKIREVRLHIIAWLGGVGLLIGLVGLQMLWFQRSYIDQAPVSGGTYAEAIRGPINTLNPLYASTPAELAASHILFSSLYSSDSTGHLRGNIATSMQNEGDKVFTVNLRKDARWHDGEKLTASDVVFTVGLMRSPSARTVMMASWQGVSVQQLGEHSVKFTLPATYAAFPQALTFSILPRHILKDVSPDKLRESTFSKSPIGSGPFSLRLLQILSLDTGRKVVHMDANRDYYLGSPRLNRLQLHIYNDDESLARALRTSEVNAATGVSGRTARTLDTRQYRTVIKPVNSGVYSLFNMSRPILKDNTVRKALQAGTDTSALRKQVFGNPKQLYLPFVGGHVDGTDAIPAPKYDKGAAIQMLEADGWVLQNGVRTKGADKLTLRVVTRKNADYESVLRSLAGQWRQLGVEVDTQVVDPSNFTSEVLHSRNYDVLVDELVIGGDPDVFAYWHSKGPQNFASYNNQTSDDALASARTNSNLALRSVKYVNFARQWLADVPAIGLYQSNLIYIHTLSSRGISDDEVVVSPDDHYSTVRYWTSELGKVYRTP